MNPIDKKIILTRYNRRIEKFGHGVMALGEPKSRQAYYFDFLMQADGFFSADSVLDVGSGYGDLCSYLKSRGWKGQYVGVDINPMLIEEGSRRYPGIDLRTMDIQTDRIQQQFDWCFCCGALTSKTEGIPYLVHLEQMMASMWVMSKKGLTLNILSPLADRATDVHARPAFEDILKLIAKLSGRFTLRHDFMPYEYAVYIYKDDAINRELSIFSHYDKYFEKLRATWSPK